MEQFQRKFCLKREDKPDCSYVGMWGTLLRRKSLFFVKIAAFEVFSGDKYDYVNVWIVKFTNKTYQMDTA